ncbi:MAG TPA: Nif3-like dinuclear metal center hexameric protein [Micromonosporaceae bacterium]|nr:Nif3-like dinuclear metal center hexameric protein [Micromonosporaceae bacterium]
MILADVVAALDARYPPDWAEDWDRVGLVVGRPEQRVSRVLAVVDVTPETVAEALDVRADLILAHHPLLLKGVSSVAATTPAGRMIHDLITGGVAAFVAHTNADVASPGVSDALADALGIVGRMPLQPTGEGRGHGRVGRLPVQLPLREFAQLAARVLPTGDMGVRIAGDPAQRITLVAVCGGSGDEFLPQARELGVDVYLTGDLKHHKVSDHLFAGGPALIDAGHFATEQPWLGEVAEWLRKETSLEIIVSQTRTDPWTAHVYGHNRPL